MSDSSKANVDARSIAMFSRIGLLEEEVMQMEDKFPSILESFQTVAAVDVDGESFSLEAKVKSDLRKDECFSSLGQERALANAPLQANGHFRVPAVL